MRLENNLRNFASFPWNWSAIFAGVFVGLAVETLLILFGAAVGTSVGDHVLGGGFALWSVIMTMLGLALGGAVGAFVAKSARVRDGLIVGFAVWSVIVVAGSALLGAIGPQTVGSQMWSRFLGALLGLGCALIGGALGTRPRMTKATRPIVTDETLPTTP